MENSNKISVVITTYNRAWCVERAIISVVNQTNHEWELIIVDDGSTDNTGDIIKKYIADCRIKYFFKKNGGVGSAKNFGLTKANNNFVTFLDSDDEFFKDTIETMADDIVQLTGDTKILLYGCEKITKNGTIKELLTDGKVIDYKDAILGSWPKIDTVQLCKIDVFKDSHFPEISGGMEDLMWLSALKCGTRAMLRNKKVLIYHAEGNDRLTSGNQSVSRAKTMPILYSIFLEKFGADYEMLNPKRLSYFLLEKSIFELIDGQKKNGHSNLFKALRYNKKKRLVIYFVFALSFLPRKVFTVFAILGHKFKSIIK